MTENLKKLLNEKHNHPLIRRFPNLESIPWIKLANLPTPVEKLNGLEKELEFEGLYIKRDDKSHNIYGGNKVRKFEYMIARAISKGKSNLVTLGGVGTNHGLAQSVFCKELGLKSTVFTFDQPNSEHVRYNLKLEQYYSSDLKYHKGYAGTALGIIKYFLTHKNWLFVWAGASVPRGSIGFVNAAFELKEQIEKGEIPEPDYIFVADGSTGTSAGLTLGCELAGLKTKIKAVAVSDYIVTGKKKVVNLAYKTWKLLKKYDETLPIINKDILGSRVDVLKDYFGGQYGLTTKEGLEALNLIKKTDGIDLDLVYTGKTCSAMIATIREKKDELKGKIFLFWNTMNSMDHHKEAEEIDFHDLPEKFHKWFNGEIPLDDRVVQARQNMDEIV